MEKIKNVSSEILIRTRDIVIFKYLNDEEFDNIIKLSEFIQYDSNEMIIAEGNVSPYFYAIIGGSVNVSVKETSGKEVFICAIGEGEVFGEAGIFLKVKRTANVISMENTTIFRIHRKTLLSYIKKYPSAGIKILMLIIYSLLNKLRDSNQEIAFERKADIDQEDIDSMVDSIMTEI